MATADRAARDAAAKRKSDAAKKAAAKKRATSRAQGRTRQQLSTPGKVQEAGVANIPASVVKAAVTIAKFASKSKAKPKPKSSGSSKPKTMSASEYSKTLREDRAAQKAYYDRQRKVPAAEAKANAKKRAAAAKRPSAAERKAAEYKASADQIERMQAGYKYKGGSGTRGGYRRGW